MESQVQDIVLVDGSQAVICAEIFAPRLTPTGKISHAKTRVYTQRYRKEWEDMPEFKGWLTSVPDQPTRALCKYCKKNLHAHRLSLLKHTCTLKHTRATQLHSQNLLKKKAKAKLKKIKSENFACEEVDLGILKSSMSSDDQENVEFVYDEERLEMDGNDNDDDDYDNNDDDDDNNDVDDINFNDNNDLTADATVVHDNNDNSQMIDESQNIEMSQNIDEMEMEMEMANDDENGDNSDTCILRVEDEDENDNDNDDNNNNNNNNDDENNDKQLSVKNIQIKKERVHTDTLAQAMANLHGEFADNDEEISNNIDNVIQHDDDNTISLINNNDNSIISSDHNVTIETTVTTSSPIKTIDDNKKIITNNNDKKNEVIINNKQQQQQQQVLTPKKTKTNPSFQRVTVNGKTYNFPSGQLISGGQLLLANALNKNNITAITLPASSKTVGLRPIAPKINKPIFVSTPVNSNKIITKQINTVKKNNNVENSIEFITTHVIDTSKGIPVNSMRICLYKLTDGRWNFINESTTTPNGNCIDIGKTIKPSAGRYKLQFDTEKYFSSKRVETLYPFIEVVLDVKNPNSNHHLEMAVSPFGYSTCRGNSR